MATVQDYGPQEEKDQEQQNEIGQSVPELSTPKAAPTAPGGQAVGGASTAPAPKPSSSGSFQDFSKFKQANTAKLQALGNLSKEKEVGKVESFANKAQSTATGQSAGLQGQRLDPSITSNLTAKNLPYKTDELKAVLDSTWDREAETKARDELAGANRQALASLGGIQGAAEGGRAGIQQMLRGQRGGGSTGATAADAMLLQSESGYRKGIRDEASRLGQQVQDTISTGDAQLDKAIQDIKQQNSQVQSGLRNRLSGIQSDILRSAEQSQRQLAADAAQRAEDQYRAQTQRSFEDQLKQTLAGMRQDVPGLVANAPGQGIAGVTDNSQDVERAQMRNQALDRLMKNPALLKEFTGQSFDDLLAGDAGLAAAREQASSGIGLSNALSAQDAAALNAIAGLQGGQTYSSAGPANVNVSGMSGENIQNLISKLTPGLEKYLSTTGNLQQPIQQVESTAPVVPGTVAWQ